MSNTTKMNKFQIKAFECGTISMLYDSLEAHKTYYMKYDAETDSYIQSDYMIDVEKVAIIEELQKKLEKMI